MSAVVLCMWEREELMKLEVIKEKMNMAKCTCLLCAHTIVAFAQENLCIQFPLREPFGCLQLIHPIR